MTPQPAPASVPARVPASTIRAVRLFHRLSVAAFAGAFQVTARTIFRWEKDGVDLNAIDPEWRRKLLIWMLERYRATSVSDNRSIQE